MGIDSAISLVRTCRAMVATRTYICFQRTLVVAGTGDLASNAENHASPQASGLRSLVESLRPFLSRISTLE